MGEQQPPSSIVWILGRVCVAVMASMVVCPPHDGPFTLGSTENRKDILQCSTCLERSVCPKSMVFCLIININSENRVVNILLTDVEADPHNQGKYHG